MGLAVRIARLTVYPLKSARGVDVTEAVAGPTGLVDDRHFMLVDETGRFYTQRECPALARIVATHEGDELALRTDAGALRVPWESRGGENKVHVQVWGDSLVCDDTGDEAAELRVFRFVLVVAPEPGGDTVHRASTASRRGFAPLEIPTGGAAPWTRRFRTRSSCHVIHLDPPAG